MFFFFLDNKVAPSISNDIQMQNDCNKLHSGTSHPHTFVASAGNDGALESTNTSPIQLLNDHDKLILHDSNGTIQSNNIITLYAPQDF